MLAPEPAVAGLPEVAHVPGLTCRFCGTPLRYTFADLGCHPPCQNVVRLEDLHKGEAFYPLHAFVCERCFLVQLDEVVPPDAIFSEYAYFSSYADSWVAHAKRYVDGITERLHLDEKSFVVEIASNDGYLLQHFVEKGIPCLGVEPAANVAVVAEAKGIPTRVAFFGEEEAERMVGEGLRADLLLGNNVLAHTPYLNSFVAGMKRLLAEGGTITMEFPHLLRLMAENQFDTIYHEHFSYFSLFTVEQVFAAHGLVLYDVEELPTHGGSLRIYARHAEDETKPVGERVHALRARELEAGIDRLETYAAFAEQVKATKRKLLSFLIEANEAGAQVVGYGAPGKGNTLLNYGGIRTDLLCYTVDRNPYKQGTYLPGTRIPVFPPEKIFETRPDYVLILPWNLREEVAAQMASIRAWGGRFVVPIPEVEVF
ncbi:MAG TPA: class I SAM-dependent methyltransferase [Rubricoccaceae bacterium]|nr:class I SAM-dependent methyltransferase [Rubricoccaceae bacterium]